jgi:dTMP kinase
LLDAPVQRAMARAAARNLGSVQDRFENERSEFFERVRGVYRARAAAEPNRIVVVDATLPVEEVGARILEHLKVRSWIS